MQETGTCLVLTIFDAPLFSCPSVIVTVSTYICILSGTAGGACVVTIAQSCSIPCLFLKFLDARFAALEATNHIR